MNKQLKIGLVPWHQFNRKILNQNSIFAGQIYTDGKGEVKINQLNLYGKRQLDVNCKFGFLSKLTVQSDAFQNGRSCL